VSWQSTKAVLTRSRLKRSRSFVVLVALAEHANREGWAWPSLARLASETELTRRSVLRHLREAEAAGELRRERHGPRGTRYQLTPGGVAIGASGDTQPSRSTVTRISPITGAVGASPVTHEDPIGDIWGPIGDKPGSGQATEPSRETPSLADPEVTAVPVAVVLGPRNIGGEAGGTWGASRRAPGWENWLEASRPGKPTVYGVRGFIASTRDPNERAAAIAYLEHELGERWESPITAGAPA